MSQKTVYLLNSPKRPDPIYGLEEQVQEFSQQTGVQFEDYTPQEETDVEKFLRMQAALRLAPQTQFVNLQNLEAEAALALDGATLLSHVPEIVYLHWAGLPVVLKADEGPVADYMSSPVLRAAMKRTCSIAVVDDSLQEAFNLPLASDVLREMRDQRGFERVFVKCATQKSFTRVDRIDSLLDFGIYDWWDGGSPKNNIVLISEAVVFEDEYRFFVVNGELVSGAPLVLRHTPLNAAGEKFDSRHVGKFDSDHTGITRVRQDPDLTAQYVAFAEETLKALRSENPEWKHFVLDIGTIVKPDGTREPALVETNGITNAGYFANDPVAVTKALLQNPLKLSVQPIQGISVTKEGATVEN